MILAHKFANQFEEFNLEVKQQNLTYPDLSNQSIPSSSACVVRRNKHQAMTNNFDILGKLLISFGITNSRLEKVNFICILPTFYKDVCYLFVIETFQVF